jgi:hypothetical protein
VSPVALAVTQAAVGAGHWAAGRRRRALAAWASAAGFGLVAWGLGAEALTRAEADKNMEQQKDLLRKRGIQVPATAGTQTGLSQRSLHALDALASSIRMVFGVRSGLRQPRRLTRSDHRDKRTQARRAPSPAGRDLAGPAVPAHQLPGALHGVPDVEELAHERLDPAQRPALVPGEPVRQRPTRRHDPISTRSFRLALWRQRSPDTGGRIAERPRTPHSDEFESLVQCEGESLQRTFGWIAGAALDAADISLPDA